jgi:hypothetical protein
LRIISLLEESKITNTTHTHKTQNVTRSKRTNKTHTKKLIMLPETKENDLNLTRQTPYTLIIYPIKSCLTSQ